MFQKFINSKTLKALGLFAIIIIFSVIKVAGKRYFRDEPAPQASTPSAQIQAAQIQKQMIASLNQAVKKINASTPTMVDAETRLDKASMGKGMTVLYHYTLVNVESNNVDKSLLEKSLLDSVLPSVCKNEDMATSIKLGVNYEYIYSSKDAVRLASFIANRKSCKLGKITITQ